MADNLNNIPFNNPLAAIRSLQISTPTSKRKANHIDGQNKDSSNKKVDFI